MLLAFDEDEEFYEEDLYADMPDDDEVEDDGDDLWDDPEDDEDIWEGQSVSDFDTRGERDGER